MGLRIKKYKDGYRPQWYAYYDDNNQRKEIRLDERISGTPPPSLSVKDRGDAEFERSRDRAQIKFDKFLDELRQRGATESVARDDEFLYPLVVCAASTGARLKDICNLQWCNIDLDEGVVSFNAAKTGSRCEIPLFPEFQKVCEELWAKREPGEAYVFPEAANMYQHNRSGLVKRGKLLFAKALFWKDNHHTEPAEVIDDTALPQISPAEVLQRIDTMPCCNKVREKAKVFYDRYAVQLLSIKKIAHEFGCCPNTVSNVLKKIERHVGVKIMRFGAPEHKARHFLPQTRMSRADNKRAVSVYGWHSFRTTFCVHAILHHVPDWMIIKAVGHATFKTTNEYYNNPKRASIKEVWMKALGSTAIGTTQTPLIQNTITIQS